jgi:CheY-like chemotaxis protein
LLPKGKAARPDVPIIMITAYGDAETKRKALEGGAQTLPEQAGGLHDASE